MSLNTAKVLAETIGVSETEIAAADHGQFLPPVRKRPRPLTASPRGRRMSLRVTILGCGSSGGVPRVGSGWGACDPRNPKNRRRRCSLLVERAGAERHDRGARRHVAGSARAAARRRRAPARRRALSRMSTPTTPTASTTCAARHRHAPAHACLHGPHHRRAPAWRASAIASRRRRAATIRRSSTSTRMTAGHDGDDRRAGRRDHGGAVPPRPRRHRRARLPLRRSGLCARRQRAFPTKAGAASRVSTSDPRRAAPHAASEPFFARRGARG